MTRLHPLLAIFLLATLPCSAWAQLGPEIQVNTQTVSDQAVPQIAADATGDFVVVWHDAGTIPVGLSARRFNSTGNPLGAQVVVTSSGQSHAVASDAAGNFVVVWRRPENVFGRRFDAAGNPLGGEFQVNTNPPTYLGTAPTVAVAPTGEFVVAWPSVGYDGSAFGVFGQRYDASGNPVGGEFLVNTYTTGDQVGPVAASDASGNMVIVWFSLAQDGDGWGLYGQRYNAAGTPQGAEFAVNTYTTNHQFLHDVAADADGNFVVAWHSQGQDGDDGAIFARRFDAAANPLGGEFQVNAYTTGYQSRPDVGVDAAGSFAVAWISPHDGDGFGIFGRRYDAAGAPVGGEFLVNGYTPHDQGSPAVTYTVAGDFVVTWESQRLDREIFAQRYDAAGRQGVRGTRLTLGDASNGRRTVNVRGREVWSNSVVLGDPLANGATLRVIAHGDADQDQVFAVPPGASAGGLPGWKAVSGGWTYTDPRGVNGPVRRAGVRRRSQNTFFLETVIRGTATTPPPGIGVVPPGNGTDGGVIFTILGPGGGTYCVDLGGANGGTARNSASRFRVVGSTTETGCPAP